MPDDRALWKMRSARTTAAVGIPCNEAHLKVDGRGAKEQLRGYQDDDRCKQGRPMIPKKTKDFETIKSRPEVSSV